MISIEFKEKLDESLEIMIDDEFNKFAQKNEVICNYLSFNFIAKDEGKVVGIINGHSYYDEVHISDLIVLKEYRNKHIYEFQAPKFYEKCGFKVEFIRENKENSKLNKYFLIKYLK